MKITPTLCRWTRIAIPVVFLATLAACGGSSGDGGSGGGGVTYTVGGMINGLTGSGLVLQNNGGGDLAVSAVGAFTFTMGLANGAAYAVTVKTQPTNPNQTCVVTHGSGTMGSSKVTNVAVTCTNTYNVSGTVTSSSGELLELVLADLALQSNLGQVFTFHDQNPSFAFGGFASGAPYAVTVKTQPAFGGPCVVIHGTGVIGTADVTNVSVACSSPKHFAYVSNKGDNTISVYSVDATGALTAVGTPVVTGTSPYAIAVSPNNQYIYVANSTSNDVSVYAVNATSGALTQIAGSPFPAGTHPQSLALGPSGAYLYVANNGSSNLSAYAVDAGTGALMPLATATYSTGTGPSAVSVDPSGTFVYVANYGGSNDISVFAITAGTGALTQVAGSPFAAGDSPHSLTVYGGPLKTFLYTANFNGTTSTISGFSVDPSTGALTALTGSPFALSVSNYIGIGGGNSLFVTTGASVVGYFIGSTGLLTSSPNYSAAAGTNAYSVTYSNGFLYVGNDGAASVSAYRVDDVSGSLIMVPGSPFPTGNNPDFIAIF